MVATLPHAKRAIDDVREHLDTTGTRGTIIEVYLARSVLITLCSEIEASVVRLINDRLGSGPDGEIVAFARSFGTVRNARAGDIGDIMKRFGAACLERYEVALVSSIGPDGRGRIGNLVTLRDRLSHGEPPQVTLRDVTLGYEDALGLVGAVEAALGATLQAP